MIKHIKDGDEDKDGYESRVMIVRMVIENDDRNGQDENKDGDEGYGRQDHG